MLLHTSEFGLVWFSLQHKLTRCQMNIVTPFWCQAKHAKFQTENRASFPSSAKLDVENFTSSAGCGAQKNLSPDHHLVRTFPAWVTHARLDVTVRSPAAGRARRLCFLRPSAHSAPLRKYPFSCGFSPHSTTRIWKELNSAPPLGT